MTDPSLDIKVLVVSQAWNCWPFWALASCLLSWPASSLHGGASLGAWQKLN